jgi:hypothetical protein
VGSANVDGRTEEAAAIKTSAAAASGALSMTDGSSMPIIDGGAFARRFNSCNVG